MIQPTPNPGGAQTSLLSTVSCVSARVCTAVGSYYNHHGAQVTLAERWNGTHWAVQATPSPPIRPPAAGNSPALGDVVCPSADACTAVGMSYTGHFFTYAERWDGRAWTLQRTPHPAAATDSGLYGVSCTAASTCTAVGNFINRAGAHLTLAERYS